MNAELADFANLSDVFASVYTAALGPTEIGAALRGSLQLVGILGILGCGVLGASPARGAMCVNNRRFLPLAPLDLITVTLVVG